MLFLSLLFVIVTFSANTFLNMLAWSMAYILSTPGILSALGLEIFSFSFFLRALIFKGSRVVLID